MGGGHVPNCGFLFDGYHPFDHSTQDLSWEFPFVVAQAAAKTEVNNAKSSREADKTLILHYIDGREEELDRRIHQRMSKTALHGFISDGNLPMTEKLLREFPEMLNEPLDQNEGGSNATLIAVDNGRLECLELLLASRADIDKSTKNDGATPTFMAAQEGPLGLPETPRSLKGRRREEQQGYWRNANFDGSAEWPFRVS